MTPSRTLLDDLEWLRIEFRNHLFEGLIVKDVESDTLLFVNQATADYVGAVASEMIGSPSSAFYPDHYEEYLRDDREIVRSGEPKLDYLEQYVAPDGVTHQIMTKKWPVKIDGRDCVCITFFDLTATLQKVSENQHYGRAFNQQVLQENREEANRLLGALYG